MQTTLRLAKTPSGRKKGRTREVRGSFVEDSHLGWGIQLKRWPHGVRIETKSQYAELIGRLLPERKSKPMTSQALEALAIVALRQPVSTGDINAIRGIESAGTVQTLRNRKLIARSPRLGPRRERIWRTTQFFLDTFGLASLDEP